jgi:DNA-binding transcriptional LysR family regulator
MDWTERIGRRLKLRDLHILMIVSRTGSMGKAASELAVSQPVVSKAISDLELAVRLRLLDRGPRGVEPTIYGRALLKWGTAVFDDLRRGVKELEFLTDPTVGELRLGCTEPMATGFVATVIERLSRQYPKVIFHVVPADRASLLERDLPERRVELVVTATPGLAPRPDTDTEVLFDDCHVVLASPQSKWAHRRKIALSDLLDEPWVLPPAESVVGMEIAKVFRANGLEPPVAHAVTFSIPLHFHLLAAGRVITMLPRSLVAFGRRLPLKTLPVRMTALPSPTCIVTLKNRTLGPLAEEFIAAARKLARSFPT